MENFIFVYCGKRKYLLGSGKKLTEALSFLKWFILSAQIYISVVTSQMILFFVGFVVEFCKYNIHE